MPKLEQMYVPFNAIQSRKSRFVKTCCLAGMALMLSACSSSSSSTADRQSTGHHGNDQAASNGNGTTAVTLGDYAFTTSQFNFVDDGNAAATNVQLQNTVEYDVGLPITRFGVDNQHIFALVENSAFDTELVSYSLKDQAVVSTKQADSYFSGFHLNGAIMTSDGTEDLNFYHIANGKITDNFFHVASVNGSIFIGDVFLDHDRLYVKDQFDLLTMPINDTTNIQTLSTISAIQWRMTANSEYVFIAAVGQVGILDTEIHRITKSNLNIANWFTMPAIQASGIAVDSNHLYISSKDDNKVYVHKLSDGTLLTSINITSPESINVLGGKLYVMNKDDQKLTVGDLDFQP